MESSNPVVYPGGSGTQQLDDVPTPSTAGILEWGSAVRMQIRLRRGLLRPAWVALCGALASGGLALSTESLLRLALLAVLVDVIWGGMWSALIETDWATPLNRWQSWRRGKPVRFLPYSSAQGCAGRLASSLGQLHSWWREWAGPVLGPTLVGLAFLLPLAIVVAAVLGARPLLTTLVAITCVQLVFVRRRGDRRNFPGARALMDVALPWLAGHALFSPPTLPSALVGLAFALTYASGLDLLRAPLGLTRWNLPQSAVLILLVTLRQPVAAGIAALFLFGQWLMQPGLVDEAGAGMDPAAASRFVRAAQPWLMATMLAAAWGVRVAGFLGG